MGKFKNVYRVAETSSDHCMDDTLTADDKVLDNISTSPASANRLIYRLNDIPPAPVLISSALQHCMLALPTALTISSIVADSACVPYDHPIRVQIFCATLFMSGISTLMQTGCGVRLPIFQGSSASFIVPVLSLRNDGFCESNEPAVKGTNSNFTNVTTEKDFHENDETRTYSRIQMMSGSLMFASLLEVVIGGIGAFRLLSSFIGPITIATTISLIGITLCKLPIMYGRPSFSLTFGCMIVVLLFMLYMKNIRIPLPKCTKSEKRQPRKYFAIFLLLPIMTTIIIMWVLTWVLTVFDVFTDDKNDPQFLARADARIDLIYRTPWFRLSYPAMFGPPKINWALTASYVVAFFASMTESIGDYYAAHKVCEVDPPPHQAISRGIFMEGTASMLSGSMGVGHGTTSYSGNISALTLTQTASRSVMYVAGFICIVLSLIGKLGAAMTTVPNPLLGGVSVIVVGSLLSLGISNLHRVDMKRTRNLIVVGVSLGSGLILPQMLQTYPDVFKTGRADLDQMLHVILGTPMFVGAVVSTFLDNTAPGSRKSRGFADMEESDEDAMTSGLLQPIRGQDVYSWRWYPRLVKTLPFLRYVPFLPK